jgi:protein SCO1/2
VNEPLSPSANPTAPAGAKTPLDLKLFYAFVTVLIAAMLGLVVFWRPGNATASKPQAPDQVRYLGEFAFTDQTGNPVTQREVAGKFVIVNFLHTSCSISCLRVNQQMAEAQRLTSGQDDVRLLSFTVDPRTDTPPVLAKFGNQFGADANRWSLLTGEKTALYHLIETSFLKREPLVSDEPAMPGGFVGVERIAVVDRTGCVRKFFDGMKTTTPAAIVKLLDELRTEANHP